MLLHLTEIWTILQIILMSHIRMILTNNNLLRATVLALIVKWSIDSLNVNKLSQCLSVRLNTWLKLMSLRKQSGFELYCAIYRRWTQRILFWLSFIVTIRKQSSWWRIFSITWKSSTLIFSFTLFIRRLRKKLLSSVIFTLMKWLLMILSKILWESSLWSFVIDLRLNT